MKGFGYIRVSTEDQAQDDRYSIPTQTRTIKIYFNKNNIELVDIFIDDVSGRGIDKRDDFQKMLSRLDEVDLVAVNTVDRHSRNMLDSLNTVDQIVKRGKTFIAIDDNLKINAQSSENEELNFHVKSMFAHYFSRQLSRTVSKNMDKRADDGNYNTKPPLGYDLVDDRLVVNEQEAEIVKKMFAYYLENMGIRGIAEELNSLGYRSKPTKKFPEGALFQAYPVRMILKNPVYTGATRWKGKTKGKTHLPIISKEVFEEVQKRMKLKAKIGGRAQKSDFLLSGILRCGHCGQAMVGNRNKGRYSKLKGRAPIYRRYICNNYMKNGACHFVWSHCEELEHLIIAAIEKEIPREEAHLYLNDTPIVFDPEQLEKEAKAIKHRLETEFPQRYDKQIQLCEKGMIDDIMLQSAFNRLKREEEEINKKLREIEGKLNLAPEAIIEMRKKRLAGFYSVFDNGDIAQRKAWMQTNIREIVYFGPNDVDLKFYI